MNLFLLNIFLALLWAAVSGSITLGSLTTGFVVGMLVLALAGRTLNEPRYLQRLWKITALFLFFIRELILSSVRVAADVLTPKPNLHPAIIAVPLDCTEDLQITLLANLISLTPGTLSLDVSEDKKTLYVHAMYASDPEALKREIKENFERRILEVTT